MKQKQDCLLTIRISAALQERLECAAEDLQELKSTVARKSIALYLDYHEREQKPLLTDAEKQKQLAENMFKFLE